MFQWCFPIKWPNTKRLYWLCCALNITICNNSYWLCCIITSSLTLHQPLVRKGMHKWLWKKIQQGERYLNAPCLIILEMFKHKKCINAKRISIKNIALHITSFLSSFIQSIPRWAIIKKATLNSRVILKWVKKKNEDMCTTLYEFDSSQSLFREKNRSCYCVLL